MTGHIKICGLKDAAMADVAIDAGADLIGLVFFPASPRHVSLEAAAEVALAARGRAGIVALMVNPDDRLLQTVTRQIPVTHLQLHGAETPERVKFIRKQYDLPVMKALGVRTANDVSRAAAYHSLAGTLLFDAKPPETASRPGGLGVPFDWSLLSGVSGDTPWLLSGGLTPETVTGAIEQTRHLPGFAGVDVSSGVESTKGLKDAGLIRGFVSAAQAAMAAPQPQD